MSNLGGGAIAQKNFIKGVEQAVPHRSEESNIVEIGKNRQSGDSTCFYPTNKMFDLKFLLAFLIQKLIIC